MIAFIALRLSQILALPLQHLGERHAMGHLAKRLAGSRGSAEPHPERFSVRRLKSRRISRVRCYFMGAAGDIVSVSQVFQPSGRCCPWNSQLVELVGLEQLCALRVRQKRASDCAKSLWAWLLQ